jgi:hypothetical protein
MEPSDRNPERELNREDTENAKKQPLFFASFAPSRLYMDVL